MHAHTRNHCARTEYSARVFYSPRESSAPHGSRRASTLGMLSSRLRAVLHLCACIHVCAYRYARVYVCMRLRRECYLLDQRKPVCSDARSASRRWQWTPPYARLKEPNFPWKPSRVAFSNGIAHSPFCSRRKRGTTLEERSRSVGQTGPEASGDVSFG